MDPVIAGGSTYFVTTVPLVLLSIHRCWNFNFFLLIFLLLLFRFFYPVIANIIFWLLFVAQGVHLPIVSNEIQLIEVLEPTLIGTLHKYLEAENIRLDKLEKWLMGVLLQRPYFSEYRCLLTFIIGVF